MGRRIRFGWSVAAVSTAAFAGATFAAAPCAFAAPTKDQCIEAHSRGQDLREQRRILRSKEQFVVCSQSTCPGPIQADCVRFLEQAEEILPSVSFGARDEDKHDLPDTQVFLDGTLVATRLDDGRVYDADPGAHVVRFVHGGKDVTVRIVLTAGEKGRAIFGVFPSAVAKSETPAPSPEPESKERSALPLVVAGVGAAGLVAGGVIFGVALGKLPSVCSLQAHTCAAPPGDPVFAEASSAVQMSNVGLGIGVAGAAVAATGLVWYFLQPAPGDESRPSNVGFAPWLAPGSGGLTVRGSL